MRKNSPKQNQASRANGAKSKGPKSAAGKEKAAQNAVRDGAFSRQVVIEQLGEKPIDFEKSKKLLWDFFQPTNTVEEMLVQDYVENWWRRERIRRAEAEELRNRLTVLYLRNYLRRTDEVEKLRSRFLVLGRNYLNALRSRPVGDVSDITAEFEEVRQELLSTTLGLGFLQEMLEYLNRVATQEGFLPLEDEILVQACCGFGSREADMCRKINLITSREMQKWATKVPPEPPAPPSEPLSPGMENMLRFATELERARERFRREDSEASETKANVDSRSQDSSAEEEGNREEQESKKRQAQEDCSITLSAIIQIPLTSLRRRRRLVKTMEERDAKSDTSMAIIDPGVCDRFSRAETVVERRMYRALSLLAAMKGETPLQLLPQSKKSG
jgi:hypothetical protein